MGPRRFRRGNRPDWSRGYEHSQRFNGAATFPPRKSRRASARCRTLSRFNGAATFPPRKCRARILQYSRALIGRLSSGSVMWPSGGANKGHDRWNRPSYRGRAVLRSGVVVGALEKILNDYDARRCGWALAAKHLHGRYPAFAVRNGADVKDNHPIAFRVDERFNAGSQANAILAPQHAIENAVLKRPPEGLRELAHHAQAFCVGDVVRQNIRADQGQRVMNGGYAGTSPWIVLASRRAWTCSARRYVNV